MNKGVRLSTGDYILFLNSGDFLASPDVLGRAAEAASAPDGAPDLLYGPILRFRPVPGHFRYQQPWMLPHEIASAVGSLGKFPVYGFPVSPALTFFSVFRGLLHHQGTFYARRLFEDFGLYDTSYRIAADFDFTARCIAQGITAKPLTDPVAIFESGGLSERCRTAGITLPVVAIGGITAADVAPLLDAGATGIALSGALLGAEDPAEETRKIMNILNHHKL